mmetsp:Transcript_111211/g.321524  ORF Transcript_111211/g.321524 Transcript_111211/m.321524 type:complete len:221 (-) Transcript_111211:214-876(-)
MPRSALPESAPGTSCQGCSAPPSPAASTTTRCSALRPRTGRASASRRCAWRPRGAVPRPSALRRPRTATARRLCTSTWTIALPSSSCLSTAGPLRSPAHAASLRTASFTAMSTSGGLGGPRMASSMRTSVSRTWTPAPCGSAGRPWRTSSSRSRRSPRATPRLRPWAWRRPSSPRAPRKATLGRMARKMWRSQCSWRTRVPRRCRWPSSAARWKCPRRSN